MLLKNDYKKFLVGILLTGLLLTLISIPMVYTKIMVNTFNDYPDHIAFAQALETGADIPVHIIVRPLYQALVYGIRMLLGISYQWSGIIISSAVAVVTGFIIAAMLLAACPKYKCFTGAAVLSVSLSIAAPIALFATVDRLYYLGYIGTTTYHNPTVNLLKPIALINLAFAIAFIKSKPMNWILVVICAVFTALSALVKPNYLICLLPALGLFTLQKIVTKLPVDWRLLIVGFFIPGVAIMTVQFLFAYAPDEPGIIFAPLAVMQYYSTNLLAKFLLSIYFPLAMTIVYHKKIFQDSSVIFSWLCFLIGAVFTYFLAEEGVRFIHGNFGWSGEITLFLLFVTMMIFWMKNFYKEEQQKLANLLILAGTFFPHVVFGIIYYLYSITQNTFF